METLAVILNSHLTENFVHLNRDDLNMILVMITMQTDFFITLINQSVNQSI